MSIEHVRGSMNHARPPARRSAPAPVRQEVLAGVPDDMVEFVRFCHRRRRVSWPALYDEMCAVAARGSFRGLGYAELADIGVRFCISDLPRLAAVTELVIAEERAREPLRDARLADDDQSAPSGLTLSPQPTA